MRRVLSFAAVALLLVPSMSFAQEDEADALQAYSD